MRQRMLGPGFALADLERMGGGGLGLVQELAFLVAEGEHGMQVRAHFIGGPGLAGDAQHVGRIAQGKADALVQFQRD